MKKLLLTIGTTISIAVPIVGVVACGGNTIDGGVSKQTATYANGQSKTTLAILVSDFSTRANEENYVKVMEAIGVFSPATTYKQFKGVVTLSLNGDVLTQKYVSKINGDIATMTTKFTIAPHT